MVIVWSFRARAEFDQLIDRIKQESPVGARRVAARIEKRVGDLAQFPYQGVRTRRGLFRLDVARTPYLVIYKISGDEIAIVAILHGRRWRRS